MYPVVDQNFRQDGESCVWTEACPEGGVLDVAIIRIIATDAANDVRPKHDAGMQDAAHKELADADEVILCRRTGHAPHGAVFAYAPEPARQDAHVFMLLH